MKKIKFLMVFFLFINVKVLAFETSVMTFNVENLFDSEDDPGKEDETYLPKKQKKGSAHYKKCKKIKAKAHRNACFELDWNEKVLDLKMKNIASTILSVQNGEGPDNLFLIEVENLNVLKKLNEKFLKKANYKTLVLIEGKDPRGIDTAFLSRYPLVNAPKLLDIPYEFHKDKDLERKDQMRGILSVEIVFPNKEVIQFLGVHLPSQGNPTYYRQQAIEFMRDWLQKNPQKSIIIGGDFNITAQEEKKKSYLKEKLAPLGLISHFDACEKCLGTHNYKGRWSFLDVLFFNKAMEEKGWKVLKDTVQVVLNKPLHVGLEGIPIRFDEEKLSGVSDHLPVYTKIQWTKK